MDNESLDLQKAPVSAKLHLKPRILLPLLLVTVVLSITLTSRIYQIEYEHIKDEVIGIQHSAQQVYELSLEKRGQELQSLLEAILRDKQLQDALKSKDRRALLTHAQPLFERLKTNSNITHFYFHGTDRVCLMRVHLPNQFGDLIDRTTLKNAESSGQTFTGAEMGPFGTFTLRAVSPWYDEGKLLGYVELGVSLDDMVNIFTQMFAVEPYLIVAKKYMVKDLLMLLLMKDVR